MTRSLYVLSLLGAFRLGTMTSGVAGGEDDDVHKGVIIKPTYIFTLQLGHFCTETNDSVNRPVVSTEIVHRITPNDRSPTATGDCLIHVCSNSNLFTWTTSTLYRWLVHHRA